MAGARRKIGVRVVVKLKAADFLSYEAYAPRRRELRREAIALKQRRRLYVGPHASVHFENRETIQNQIQEMLYIERGGAAQLEDELAAYTPLIPGGDELVATILFELEDAAKRERFLSQIGGIEKKIYMKMGPETLLARSEEDLEYTTSEGKASSVLFVHFDFTPALKLAFMQQGDSQGDSQGDPQEVWFGFSHPNYLHAAQLSPALRLELGSDFTRS